MSALDQAIACCSSRNRARVAEICTRSELPVFRAFGYALLAANAYEDAQLAELELSLVLDKQRENDERAALIPPPPSPRGNA